MMEKIDRQLALIEEFFENSPKEKIDSMLSEIDGLGLDNFSMEDYFRALDIAQTRGACMDCDTVHTASPEKDDTIQCLEPVRAKIKGNKPYDLFEFGLAA